MSSIFISHAVADQRLAKFLVDFLKEAIGVPNVEIFCSSIADNGIPFGADFNDYIREQIQAPKLVLLLMTPAYLESAFCMMELGAAWSRGHLSLAIVVPPVRFDTVTKTLGLKQAWDISRKDGLIELRKMIAPLVTLEPRGEHAWDEKRTAWKADLKKVLKLLAPARNVDAVVHAAAKERIEEIEEEVADLETQLDQQKELVAALEQAKDRVEVKKIKGRHSGSDALQEYFEEMLEEVKSARPDDTPNVVFRYLLMAHYSKEGSIDWYSDEVEFTAAVQRNLLRADDNYSVRWDTKKLKPLDKALDAMEVFLRSEDGRRLTDEWDDHVPHEPDDIDFWKHHLHI